MSFKLSTHLAEIPMVHKIVMTHFYVHIEQVICTKNNYNHHAS